MAVVALAGRRIDREGGSPPRFLLAQVPAVQDRLRALFEAESVEALVCSAACGADLAALTVALAIPIRCIVVLPFDKERFRNTSVTDRPGDWGKVYDVVVGRVEAAGDLVVIESLESDADEAYRRANVEILRRAAALGRKELMAVIVWEGGSKGDSDATEGFCVLAESDGFRVVTVLTTAAA